MVAAMATLSERDYGMLGADLVLSIYLKVLAQTVVSVPALCLSLLPKLGLSEIADRQKILVQDCSCMSCSCCTSPGFGNSEACPLSEQLNAMADSSSSEEESLSTCKANDVTMKGPDTSVRLRSKDINAWVALATNKDDDDDDEDDGDDEEDDDEDAAEDEDAGDLGEGEEDVEGNDGDGGDDDDGDDEDDDGKGDEEEDEDGVEDEEDEDGVEDEEEDEEDDEDDETPEPPQKKRK